MNSLLVSLLLCPFVQGARVRLPKGDAAGDAAGDAVAPFVIAKFSEDQGTAWRKRLGVIILDVDEVIEEEFPKLMALPDGAVLYHSRMGKGPKVTAHDLDDLKKNVPNVSALLPAPGLQLPPFKYDAVGFACTSAAIEIGEEKLGELVAKGLSSVGGSISAAQVTNPMTAAKRALTALGAKRIAVLTPYTKDISLAEVNNFIAAGFAVQHIAYYNQTLDAVIARITPESTLNAIVELAKHGDIDAVFVSCTNVRIVPILAKVEKIIGVPVISSNTAFAWDMLRLAGLSSSAGGQLYQQALPRPWSS